MSRQTKVNLGNLVLSLSDAMDLASPVLIQHQQRVAFMIWKMGVAAKLSQERLGKLFIAALLHDIGAFSLEEKIAVHNFEVVNPEKHCIRGTILLNNIEILRDSAKIVRYHHTGFDNWNESIENPLVFDSQLMFIADLAERSIDRSQYILHQTKNIISLLKSHSRKSIHPQIMDLFSEVSQAEEFWFDLVSHRLYSLLLNEGPFRNVEMEICDISLLSELFRNIIDFRSRFTSTHSSGVAASASLLTKIFGFTDNEVRLMELAGNLHDIGKLAIPNAILNKPGKLTKEEMDVMKSHTYYTYSVINTIGSLKHIAEWAAYHHEKLDGSGYPFRCSADELTTGSRIMMVADIFTALEEDRPYRKSMGMNETKKVLQQLVNCNLIDEQITKLLFENFEEITNYRKEKQAITEEFYESQFAFMD